MISRQTMEEWNDGTIYRIFVQRNLNTLNNIISVPVDIAQSELTGKVLMGVESLCIDRQLVLAGGGGDIPVGDTKGPGDKLTVFKNQTTDLIENWANVQYIQLASVNLPPDIDYTTDEDTQTGQNSQIFARIPLPVEYILIQSQIGGAGGQDAVVKMNPRVAVDYNLNKDGILYEMTNNPNALGNGRINIRLVDNNNGAWDLSEYPIFNLQFTLVIYKPRNTYN